MVTNCVNCGAAITGGRCAFCSTRYDIIAKISEPPIKHLSNKGMSGVVPHIGAYDVARTYKKFDIVLLDGYPAMVCGVGDIRRLA